MGPSGSCHHNSQLCSACKSKENHFESFIIGPLLLKKEAKIFFVQEPLN